MGKKPKEAKEAKEAEKAQKAQRKAEKLAAKAAAKAAKKQEPSFVERRLASLAPEAADTAPTMPVGQALLEAERVYREAKGERGSFKKLPGFDIDDLDYLRDLLVALDDAEDAWRKHRLDRRSDPNTEARREAEDLRASAISSGRYLLRHDPRAQAELDFIAEGEGLADLIQDLRDLNRFITAHSDAYAGDLHLPEGAAARMLELATTLMASADNDQSRAALALRNRCYHALQHAVSEVRAAARYLFRGKPKRLDAFVATFAARKSTKRPAPATA